MAIKNEIGIGLLGLGVVGSKIAGHLLQNLEELSLNLNEPMVLRRVLVRNMQLPRSISLPKGILTDDFSVVLNDPNIHIVVEVMGGETPAADYLIQLLKNGKSVVTANKEVLSKRGGELLSIAAENGVQLFYEASVGGGIPIIGPLMNDLTANKIQSIRGIINGTTNFILSKMAHEGADFNDVLAEAQSLGYAESDPTADIDGFDSLYKISVLARLAFHTEVPVDSIHQEGIRNVHAKDFRYASELGYTIKLLAVAQASEETGLLARVHPVLIPLDVPMASVNGALNAVEVEGDLVGPLWFQGPGAGPEPTASAVVGDVLRIAKGGPGAAKPVQTPAPFDIAPMGDHVCQFFLRVTVADRPGVLASIAKVLGDADISIDSVLQKDSDVENQSADLVIMTHPAQEAKMQDAVNSLRQLEAVVRLDSLLRVETYPNRS